MSLKLSDFCKNSNLYKMVFSILAITFYVSLLFGSLSLKSFASTATSEEFAEVKAKDINAREIAVKAGSCQIVKSNKERLYFDLYWFGIYVGNAVLEAINDKGILKITSRAQSAPVISAFYKVEDYAESLIIQGRATHFRIKQREGRYRSDKETVFDLSNQKIIYSDYLKGKKKEHVMEGPVWDVISGFYYLRTQPFVVGKTIYIDIFDSNKLLKAEVSVLRKEKIKVYGKGEVDTIVVKPDLKSEGLFHRKGNILIWLMDDESKMPVRVETKVPIGKVVAELKKSEIEN
jgi:hypothetical protein